MAVSSFLDRCAWLATSGGTGSFVLSAALAGYQTMASASAVDGTQYDYVAQSTDLTQWEYGHGTWTVSTSTLTRVVTKNSLGTSVAINFTNPPQVLITLAAADFIDINVNSLTSATTLTLNGKIKNNLQPGNATFGSTSATLDTSGQSALSVANGAHAFVSQSGQGMVLIIVNIASTSTSVVILSGGSVTSISTGANWQINTTSPSAGNQSVANDGVTGYQVYNNVGSTQTYGLIVLKPA